MYINECVRTVCPLAASLNSLNLGMLFGHPESHNLMTVSRIVALDPSYIHIMYSYHSLKVCLNFVQKEHVGISTLFLRCYSVHSISECISTNVCGPSARSWRWRPMRTSDVHAFVSRAYTFRDFYRVSEMPMVVRFVMSRWDQFGFYFNAPLHYVPLRPIWLPFQRPASLCPAFGTSIFISRVDIIHLRFA